MNMISIFLVSLFFLGCTSLSPNGNAERVPASEGKSPRLFIQPAPIFDMVCKLKTGFKIEPNLESIFHQDLYKNLNRFQAEWDKASAGIISESEKSAGRKFNRKEYSVALTLCDWIPMADPAFIVSAFPYLGPTRKMNGFDLPMNMHAFVSMTHHELLHSLVDNIGNFEFSNTSKILAKYKAEPINVLFHLHLMAIQKAAYTRLNDRDLMKATDQLYAFIGGDYQRAWQIVTLEGVEKFLSELQTFNSKIN